MDNDDMPADAAPEPGIAAVRRARDRARSATIIPLRAETEPGGGGPDGPGGGGGQPSPAPDFNPADHWGNALELLDVKYKRDGYSTLLDQDGLLEWSPGHGWRTVPDGALDAVIYPTFDRRTTLDRKGEPRAFHVNDAFSNNITKAVRARLHTKERFTPPCYLPARDAEAAPDHSSWPPADQLVPVANGLVDYKSLNILPSTPRFFSYGSSPVLFDPYAECPAWVAFNQEIFGGDAEMVQAAQEFAGYGLSDLTSMQKIGWLMGPTRSGKSTWIKLVEHIIGEKNVIGPSMFTLAQPFGLQSFIGKKWATFGDARVPERADRKIILDRILSVSGEDTQTIERKFQSAWSGRLPTRMFFISNELPELADTANAFAARIILLQTCKSFSGSEDEGLEHKLRAEASGILNWMLAGLRRVRQRGRFVQPSASADALKSLRDLSSPMSAFVAECCTEGPGERVPTVDFFHARKAWDQLQGIDRRLTQAQCGKQIRSAVAGVRIEQPRAGGGRIREYIGIGLNSYGMSLLDPQGRLT